MADYYCLMAGTPDLEFSEQLPALSLKEFRDEAHTVLTERDWKGISTFFLRYDCMNIVRMLKGHDDEIDSLGIWGREEYEDLLRSAREINYNVKRYPAFMSVFAREYPARKDDPSFFAEDVMTLRFLEYAIATSTNPLMRQWWQLQLDLGNALTALIARKQGWNPADYVMGEGELQEMLRENMSADFGMGLVWPYAKELMEIADEGDPVKKERLVDALKWNWLDERADLDPFSLESVFGHMCKLEMIDRWQRLDPERGRKAFEEMISRLRTEGGVAEAAAAFDEKGPKNGAGDGPRA